MSPLLQIMNTLCKLLARNAKFLSIPYLVSWHPKHWSWFVILSTIKWLYWLILASPTILFIGEWLRKPIVMSVLYLIFKLWFPMVMWWNVVGRLKIWNSKWMSIISKLTRFLLKMGSCNVPLGAEWIHTLGPITMHFKDLYMSFTKEGQKHALKGITSSSPKNITSHCMETVLKKGY